MTSYVSLPRQSKAEMLSHKQLDYFTDSYHSFNVQSGAVSSGKTFIQTLRWYKHIYDVPDGVLLMMSGKTSESLYDNVIHDLEKMNPADIIVRDSPLRIKVPSKDLEIACADAHNETSWGRIQGKTVYGWLADEVTQYPETFVKMAQSRCRGGGKIWPKFWTCNPDVPEHFIRSDYIDNPNIDIRTWEFSLYDNPVLSEEYMEELKASYSGIYYDRYILGKWVHAEGMVYDEFNRDTHIIEPLTPPEGWPVYGAIDWGYTNPFVFLWATVDPDGRIIIFDEHYESKRLIEYHANKIKSREYQFQHITADHDAQDNAEIEEHGIITNPAIKDVSIGIQKVKARLKTHGDGRPRLFITRNCKNLLREFPLYRWSESKHGKADKEEPVKVNDHAMDAVRYLVMSIDNSQAPRVWRL